MLRNRWLLFILICSILRLLSYNLDISVDVDSISKLSVVQVFTQYSFYCIVGLLISIGFVVFVTYIGKRLDIFLCSSFMAIILFSSWVVFLANICVAMFLSFLITNMLIGMVFGYPLLLQLRNNSIEV